MKHTSILSVLVLSQLMLPLTPIAAKSTHTSPTTAGRQSRTAESNLVYITPGQAAQVVCIGSVAEVPTNECTDEIINKCCDGSGSTNTPPTINSIPPNWELGTDNIPGISTDSDSPWIATVDLNYTVHDNTNLDDGSMSRSRNVEYGALQFNIKDTNGQTLDKFSCDLSDDVAGSKELTCTLESNADLSKAKFVKVQGMDTISISIDDLKFYRYKKDMSESHVSSPDMTKTDYSHCIYTADTGIQPGEDETRSQSNGYQSGRDQTLTYNAYVWECDQSGLGYKKSMMLEL